MIATPVTSTRALSPTHPAHRTWLDQTDEPGDALEILATSDLGFILMAVGLLAAMLWTATPILTSTGIIGVILLATGLHALIAASTSPIAILLLAFAAASLWFEIRYLPGGRLYAITGWFALVLAGFTLHGTWQGAHPAIVLPLATLTAAGTYLAGARAWQRIDSDPMACSPLLPDRHTTVLDTDGDRGHAILAGRIWPIRAGSSGGRLMPGQPIRVIEVTGDTLLVESVPPGKSRRPWP